jgi:hypothetical protein
MKRRCRHRRPRRLALGGGFYLSGLCEERAAFDARQADLQRLRLAADLH